MTPDTPQLSRYRTIQVLSEGIANRIAAGEVVERPASVAKELIENALDAEATEITVSVKKAGLEELMVADNGWGMNADDLSLAFRRHATSKIREADDLQHITHMGFRGEALPSIASVARIEATSRRDDKDEGVLFRVDGGKVLPSEPAPRDQGTTIRVRSLFFNVPARRKFLRSPATEYGHIVTAFKRYAVAYPELRWVLIKDDSEIHDLPPTDLKGRIGQLFGADAVSHLHDVDSRSGDLLVHGVAGGEGLFKRSRGDQFLFVNRRPFQSTSLHHAVVNGFGPLIQPGQVPFYVLHLRLDPEEFDVNVHPAKHEVRFRDEGNAYRGVLVAIRSAFGLALRQGDSPVRMHVQDHKEGESGYRPQQGMGTSARGHGLRDMEAMYGRPMRPSSLPQEGLPLHGASQGDVFDREQAPTMPQRAGEDGGMMRPVIPQPPRTPEHDPHDHPPLPADDRAEELPHEPSSSARGLDQAERKNVWQLHRMYILSQVKSGLVVIDQHVAHERILYERALKAMRAKGWSGQRLLFPAVIGLDSAESALLEEIAPILETIGLEVQLKKGSTWEILSVPTGLKVSSEARLLKDILEDYRQSHDIRLDPQERLAASFACKAAIKAGDPLNLEEMNALIDELFLTEYPFVCPHGRPVVVNLTLSDLHKLFGRE